MMFGKAIIAAVIAMVVVTAASTAADVGREQSLATQDQADKVTKGKALYAQYCSHCHGINMISPSNAAFDLRQFPSGDKQRFFNSVNQGKNNRMPAWGDLLQSSEIDEIWAYVQTGGKK